MKTFCKLTKKSVPFQTICGLIFKTISVESSQIHFITDTERQFVMFHERDCCEQVFLDDVIGDIDDLLNNPILIAEVSTNRDNPKNEYDESCTWTFYKIATINGYVDLRWYGTSNGYYSEEVDFCEYVIED